MFFAQLRIFDEPDEPNRDEPFWGKFPLSLGG
jgi:hypothetical protein